MNILLACLNANDLGGSELFHYELSRALYNIGHDVTLFTLRNIKQGTELRNKLDCVLHVDLNTIKYNTKYDIIVASQPEVVRHFIDKFDGTPIISIIHSEIRSETPIIHPRILHYISIRPSISKMLNEQWGIDLSKISLIYNPIDGSRFNEDGVTRPDKTTGLFVGEVLDPIRHKAFVHIAEQCIVNDWNLKVVSKSRHHISHPNIIYYDVRWNVEELVKQCHFTAGILLGRTTLEGWKCGMPGYMYIIDERGNILTIESQPPNNIVTLCDSEHVAKQHETLYLNIIHNMDSHSKLINNDI